MSKLWIIGDSFADKMPQPDAIVKTWVKSISEKYNGETTIVSARPSRDFQTILDIFLKSLKDISPDDFVILVFPTLERVRLSLETPKMEFVKDYFIGDKSYNEFSIDNILEYPLSELKGPEFKNELSVGIWKIVNCSRASMNNYLDIIQSLKSYLPFDILVWSWTDETNSELILNKSNIIDKLGFWKTLNDDWIESGGTFGKSNDLHWSQKTHNAFADYIIKSYPQYFQ